LKRILARRALLAAAGLWAASGHPVARANDADKGAAQVLFEQGRALVQAHKFADACPKFAESLRLDPGIGTMLWLADCYENNGQTASAWAEFKEASASATLKQDPRATVARRRADDLEPKLARLVIVPPPDGSVAGIEVKRDGVTLGAAELGVAVPVNPGAHALSASAPGKRPWSTSITVLDKPGTVSAVVPVLEAAPEAIAVGGAIAAPPGATSGPESAAADRPAGERAWGPRQTVGLATGGAGLIAVAIGAYFGLEAKSTYDGWQGSCGATQTSSSCVGQRDSASTQALASDVLFGVGAAAIVGGAVVYFTAPRSSNRTATITPSVSPKGASLSFSKTW
jgi:hypothetical protein